MLQHINDKNKFYEKKFFIMAPYVSPYAYFVYFLSKFYLSFGLILAVVLLIEGLYSKKFRKTWWIVIILFYLVSIYFQSQSNCLFEWKQGCPVY